MERLSEMEPDSKRSAVRPSLLSDDIELLVEGRQPLVKKPGALQPGSVQTFAVKKRRPSSSLMAIGLQAGK